MSETGTHAILPRSFKVRYPVAVRGEGAYLYDDKGKRYLDACGGAAVMAIGHGVREIVEQMTEAALRLPYVHSSQFHPQAALELADVLSGRFPAPGGRALVHFTSGGSEATETAMKITRQYWLSRGQPQRYKFISRWHSYHGATLGALGLSGNVRRRKSFEPLLPPVTHISACFCYHCPLGLAFPACQLACARELEETIVRAGPAEVAAFICEPVVGATSGAVPPDGYLQTIRDICDRYHILMIADEIMSGVGRTGKYFAVEHWSVAPDIILLGKGLSSGYAPLGAVLVAEKVWRAIEGGTGSLEHGFTYQEHPTAMAAGLAVQRYLENHNLIDRAAKMGEYLARGLERLRELPCVGDVRGKGLLQTVEFVADRERRTPFPAELRFVERVFEELRDLGVLVYPMRGTADGVAGEHIMLAPPFIIEEGELDFLVDAIARGVAKISQVSPGRL